MSNFVQPDETATHELVISRLIDAPAEKLFRAWTEPALLKQWFVPAPWSVASAEVDLRVGGSNTIVMRSPEGEEFPNSGIYLEIIPNQRLVFTDAYSRAWVPSQKPFMTAIISFDNEQGKTRYTARVLHWNEADKQTHEDMGFYQGWGQCADQLEHLVKTI